MSTDRAAAPLPAAARAPAQGRDELLLLAIGMSVAAGVIHVRTGIDHAGHYWLFGVFFGVLAYFQLLWALWVYRRPGDERALLLGAAVSLAVIGVWLVSRTIGVPLGPWAGRAEPVEVADVTASLDELVIAGALLALVRPGSRFGAAFDWLRGANCVRVGTALSAFSVLALMFGQHAHA